MPTPTKFTPEMAKAICERIADGRSLRAICEDADMPHRTTVADWLERYPEFVRQYGAAVLLRADADAEDIVDIADTEKDAQKARNRIDARKWRAAHMNPKKYGNRVALTGANGGPIQTMDLSKVSDADLERLEAILGPLAVAGGDPSGEGEAGGGGGTAED